MQSTLKEENKERQKEKIRGRMRIMQFFLIMIAPPLIVLTSLAALFIWGAKGKEAYDSQPPSA
jgi:hypothetical protein